MDQNIVKERPSLHEQSNQCPVINITVPPVKTTPQRTDLTPGAGALVPPLSPSLVTGGVSDENLDFCRMAFRTTPYLDVLTLPMGRGMQTPVMLRSGRFFCSDCSDCGCDPQCTCGRNNTGRCTCKLEYDCPERRFMSFLALEAHIKIIRTTRKYSVLLR